jgi:hypothetical protein
MKIALLGTGFGQAHAAVYAERSDIDEVLIFGRSPQKLAKINDQLGFATTTDLDAVITDPSVDLVDICLPTTVHAEVAARAMQAGKESSSNCRWPPHSRTPTALSPPRRRAAAGVRGHVLPLQPSQPAPAPSGSR